MSEKYNNITLEQALALLEKYDKELKRKEYGLVWDCEKEPEKVVEDCKQFLPVLKEDKSKHITTGQEQDNILIEGDNYHALQVLSYTHKGKIDVIYIDPPYNTGNKDFVYNDRFVDKEDGYRHSKWLNFMEKRLDLARDLLTEEGVIFISIDDNEQANLKLLCDKIFSEGNFVALLPTIMNLKGNNDQFGFAGTHEYTFVYCKDITKATINHFQLDDETVLTGWDEDEYGFYKKGSGLLATSFGNKREERPYMYFPVLIKDNEIHFISNEEYNQIYNPELKCFNDHFVEQLKEKYTKQGFDFVLPVNKDGESLRWTWGWDGKFKSHKSDIIVSKTKNGYSLSKKQRPEIGDLPSKKPKSLFYKPSYSSGNGTQLLKEMFKEKVFTSPKPLDLIKDLINLGSKKTSLILDFMAGSGTTGHAVLELNKEDGGSRQFILCTNNELNGVGSELVNQNPKEDKDQFGICQRVTYPRIAKVINGYNKNGDGQFVEGLGGNLRYFKTDFIKNSSNEEQLKINLTKRCTEILALKEGIFNEVKSNDDFAILKSNTEDKHLCIYYNFINESFDKFLLELQNIKSDKVAYVFSLDDTIDDRLFSGIDNLRLEPVPAKILTQYRKIMRKHLNILL